MPIEGVCSVFCLISNYQNLFYLKRFKTSISMWKSESYKVFIYWSSLSKSLVRPLSSRFLFLVVSHKFPRTTIIKVVSE